MRFWEVATARWLPHGPGQRGAVSHLAFSGDGRLLLSGGADTTALLWDVPRLEVPPRADQGK